MTDQSPDRTALMKHTAEIVAAHISNNAVAANDLPTMIQSVFAKLADLGKPPWSAPTEVVHPLG